MTFVEKTFDIPAMSGISTKTIEEHLKLYSGYVKHANLIQDKLKDLYTDQPANAYIIGELQRRFAFEFDGMRNHELYFEQFVGGSNLANSDSSLVKAITENWGSLENWISQIKSLAMTRGIGWAILHYDKVTGKLLNSWVEEQHLGHLTGVDIILALDMWEHSYMLDYVPSEKKKYIEAFFESLNFSVLEDRFDQSKA